MSYAVTESTPGYMPDAEPAVFDDLDSAKLWMAHLADEIKNDLFDGDEHTIFGYDPDGLSVRVENIDRPHDLGRIIEIHPAETEPPIVNILAQELGEEALAYLAAVDVFRAEGHEPTWRE